jgi:hypothetical protein
MYAIVPAVAGVPQVGRRHLHEAMSINENQAVAKFDGPLEEGWVELTEEEYQAYWAPPERPLE